MKLTILAVYVQAVIAAVGNASTFQTSDFDFQVEQPNNYLVSLAPRIAGLVPATFDFSPVNATPYRQAAGHYHTGDIRLRFRTSNQSSWISVDSALSRDAVQEVGTDQNTTVLSVSDITNTLNSSVVKVIRSWEQQGDDLVMMFNLTNTNSSMLEIGGLGFPIEINNVLQYLDAEGQYQNCSFTDPNMGLDAGYFRVTRLNGDGPAVIGTPMNGSGMEAWNFLSEPVDSVITYQAQTFEGIHEWVVFSTAYAETDWEGIEPWNEPTSTFLSPGETKSYGIRFSLVDEIRNIEQVLQSRNLPVANGIPGFIIPSDLVGKLFLNYNSSVSSISVSPQSALTLTANGVDADGWKGFDVSPNATTWGRVRVTITYDNQKQQSLHYYITQSLPTALKSVGNFHTNTCWFTQPDVFNRSPSALTYDHQVDNFVTQDPREWIPGLEDEAGVGPILAAASKQYVYPNAMEIARIEEYVNQTLWGNLQLNSGNNTYAIRATLFFYDPSAINFTYDTSIDWGLPDSAITNRLDRTFNYPHIAIVYWILYRTARLYPNLTTNSWEFYLEQTAKTIQYMIPLPNKTALTSSADQGLIEESTLSDYLNDLERENKTELATDFTQRMLRRAELWSNESFPFGSEQSWDCTGQEAMVNKTLNTILGYTPTVNHWGYDGNARRYWDFTTAGKINRVERQIHHYGSTLNAIPVIDAWKDDPSDLYLLRLGYAGMMASTSNIHKDGFGSCAFHSYLNTLEWDPYTGDFGSGFWGAVHSATSMIISHPTFGWQAYGGNLNVTGSSGNEILVMQPRDLGRRRVFIAPIQLEVDLNAGYIDTVTYRPGNRSVVELQLISVIAESNSTKASSAILRWSTRNSSLQFHVTPGGDFLGAQSYVFLPNGTVTVTISQM